MASTVWKYPIRIHDLRGDQITLDIPEGGHHFMHAAPLDAADINVWLWLYEPENPVRTTVTFRVAGTGHPIGPVDYHVPLATIVTPLGVVWHLFYVLD